MLRSVVILCDGGGGSIAEDIRRECDAEDTMEHTHQFGSACRIGADTFVEVVSSAPLDAPESSLLQGHGDGAYRIVIQVESIALVAERFRLRGIRPSGKPMQDPGGSDSLSLTFGGGSHGGKLGCVVELQQQMHATGLPWFPCGGMAGWPSPPHRSSIAQQLVGAVVAVKHPRAVCLLWADALGCQRSPDGLTVLLDTGRIRFLPLGGFRTASRCCGV